MHLLNTFAKAESRIAYYQALLAERTNNPYTVLTNNNFDSGTCTSSLNVQSLKEKAETPHFIKSEV